MSNAQSLVSKPLLENLYTDLTEQVEQMIDSGTDPHLAVVLIGNDEASLNFISIKTKAAKKVGIIVSLYHIEEDESFADIEKTVRYLADDEDVHGIILQLPLPEKFTTEQTETLINLIPAVKDVDGLKGDWKKLTYKSFDNASLLQQQPYALPPMIGSVTGLLNYYNIPLEGKKIVLIGKGRLVGRPLYEFYSHLHLDVRSVDEETPQILEISKEADILITGTGEDNLVTYQWIKEGAVVIDCAHDVHADSVSQVASALSPAIGGVGPLTVFWLLHNTYQAAKNVS